MGIGKLAGGAMMIMSLGLALTACAGEQKQNCEKGKKQDIAARRQVCKGGRCGRRYRNYYCPYVSPFDDFRRMEMMIDDMMRIDSIDFPDREQGGCGFSYSSNVESNKDGAKITLALPGTPKDEIRVNVEDDSLCVFWKKTPADKDGKTDFAFKRCVALGPDMDQEKIKANYKDGLLTIVIPRKAPESQPAKSIDIE